MQYFINTSIASTVIDIDDQSPNVKANFIDY